MTMIIPEIVVLTNADGTTREMTGDQFKRILQSKLTNVIDGEGSVSAKVVSMNPWHDEENDRDVIIVSFNVISMDQVNTLKGLLAENDLQGALNLSLTTTLNANSRFTPSVGEIVRISVGEVANREGDNVLRVTGISALPKASKKALSFDDLLAKVDEVPDVEPAATAIDATTISNMSKEDLLALANANNVDITAHLTGNGSIRQKSIPDVVKVLTEELV